MCGVATQAAEETLSWSHWVALCQINDAFLRIPTTLGSYKCFRGRILLLFLPYPALFPVVDAYTSISDTIFEGGHSCLELLAAQYKVLELLTAYILGNQHNMRPPAQLFRIRFYVGMANSATETPKMTQPDFGAYMEIWNEFISSDCHCPGRFETRLRDIVEYYPSLMEGFIIFSETLRLTLPPVYFVESPRAHPSPYRA